MKKFFNLIIYSLILVTFLACSNHNQPTKLNSTVTKSTLTDLSSDSIGKTSTSTMRIQALRDTALSVGARGGLAMHANEINATLLTYDQYLTRVFNFYGMLLDNNILPPVLVEARKTLNLASDDVIRIAERNYKILHQAKFITSPPTWRDYLWMDYNAPETPDKSLLPKNNAEKIIWAKYIDEGWEAGIHQATIIFKENLNRLTRDYEGMIRYRRLLAQNMVSAPFVAAVDLGITGNGANMTVNDRILRITAFPSLQTNSKLWKTEIKIYE